MKFRQKIVEIEALQFTGSNHVDVIAFTGGAAGFHGKIGLIVKTLHGHKIANTGDWIVRDLRGRYYPCHPGLFEAIYEPVL